MSLDDPEVAIGQWHNRGNIMWVWSTWNHEFLKCWLLKVQKCLSSAVKKIGSRPDVSTHVEKMIAKFQSRMWVLYHLKNARVPPDDMLVLYKSLIRPVLDFAVPAYHSLLTQNQSERIERLQRSAFKIIFGWAVSYRTVLEEKQEESLCDRRIRLVDQFTKKANSHPRFGPEWFAKRKEDGRNLRRREALFHPRPRTERFKNNPVNYMRKRIENNFDWSSRVRPLPKICIFNESMAAGLDTIMNFWLLLHDKTYYSGRSAKDLFLARGSFHQVLKGIIIMIN